MKYQQILLMRLRNDGSGYDYRQLAAPVSLQYGKWMPCGECLDETPRLSQGEIAMGVAEYEECMESGDVPECGELHDFPTDDEWLVAARFWLPDDYVPESQEVIDERNRRVADKLRDLDTGGSDA
jgi:hypothetical protein